MAYHEGTYIGEAYEVIVNNRKITMYAYIPKDIKNGSTVNGSIYWTGAGGYAYNPGEYKEISDYYKDNDNLDYIFIAMDDDRQFDGVTNEAIQQVIKQVEADYHITIDVSRVEGLSAGGDAAVATTLNIIHSNPGAEPQQMVLYDPYSSNSGFYYRLTDDDLKAMRQNGTSAFLIMPPHRSWAYRGGCNNEASFANALVRGGIPTIIVDGNFEHGYTTCRALYDGWVDYINGYIDLEDIDDSIGNYRVNVPSVSSDGKVTWDIYTLAELKDAKAHDLKKINYALDSLDEMRVKVDADTLLKRADTLLNGFEAFLTTNPPTASYSSTSNLIPAEFDSLTTIVEVLGKIGSSVQKEINSAIHATESYLKLENELKENTSGLNALMKDKLDDLRIPEVALEVKIDDPDENKKKNNNNLNGNYTYTPGSGSVNNESAIEKSANDEEAEAPTEEDKNPKQEPIENSKQEESKPTTVSYSGGGTSSSKVTVSNMVKNEEKVDTESNIKEEDVIVIDSDDSNTDTNDVIKTEEPTIVVPDESSYSPRKSNNVIKTIGAITTAGAAVAAGVYGVKKYKEKQEGSDYDDDDDIYDSFDKTPSGKDEI